MPPRNILDYLAARRAPHGDDAIGEAGRLAGELGDDELRDGHVAGRRRPEPSVMDGVTARPGAVSAAAGRRDG